MNYFPPRQGPAAMIGRGEFFTWPRPRRHAMLPIGGRAPEFTLPDQNDQSVSLSTLLRHGPLILYFYPADFTPGCTREACSIRDLHPQLLEAGLCVAGISPQAPESHQRFRDRHQLPFVLLSDPDKTVVRMYDVLGPLGF